MTRSPHGVLNLLKPPGMTSHDAVAWARRVLKTRRVGHIGTLDPAASGVLPLCVGQATRLVELLQSGRKGYLAEASFGYETDTGDAVGQRVANRDASGLNQAAIEGVLKRFRGDILQQPPLHSALKIGGRRLYEIAREGATIEIPFRPITVWALEVTRFWPTSPGGGPRAFLRIECSGGTYIRSLVRDIGRELDVAATMSFLTRTRSGGFDLAQAVTMEEFEAAPHLLSLVSLLANLADTVVVDDDLVLRLWQGRAVSLGVGEWGEAARRAGARVVVCNREGTLLALVNSNGDDAPRGAEKVFDLREN